MILSELQQCDIAFHNIGDATGSGAITGQAINVDGDVQMMQ